MTFIPASPKALSIRVDGIVQGVGFRPFIYRLAGGLSLEGWVENRNDGVLIHVQGADRELDRFMQLLGTCAPAAASISKVESLPVPAGIHDKFIIRDSGFVKEGITGVSPDISVCAECIEDIKRQPHRQDYPLVNCTNCGPRFSIIGRLPYDRENTSMSHFAMCDRCKAEYHDPANRRFHAQPVACNHCGPVYTIDDRVGQEIDIEMICSVIESGGIILLKGTGGYNLVCDATSKEAVKKIRDIKDRERKPFAIMFGDTEAVKYYCLASEKELEALQSWRRPVVLLKQRARVPGGRVPSEVNGQLGTIGAILPYMAIHYLIFEKLQLYALVYTSANISGYPIVAVDKQARELFAGKVSMLVSCNREILNPVDDSVCRLTGNNIQIIRRARGFVPEMTEVDFQADGIFAAGSDLKNTFAIGKGNRAIVSQYMGDLDNYETLCRYRDIFDRYCSLFRFKPEVAVCDLHPGFQSSRFAAKIAERNGIRLIGVQHHHAHIASCMAEHGLEEPVIGVCFDGTGYGEDGRIWGSEFMVSDFSGYKRYGHFNYIPLPGGDSAVREPWRIALACLRETGNRHTEWWIENYLSNVPAGNIATVERMIAKKINSPLSCSAGRLFDAIAALTGLCLEAGYDGEAPMLLESICQPGSGDGYDFTSDSLQVIGQVMDDLKKNTPRGVIASRFHNGVASAISGIVNSMHRSTGISNIVLSGGVFQNSFLMNRVMLLFRKGKLKIFTNERVPVNDGGLALGQLAIAAHKIG